VKIDPEPKGVCYRDAECLPVHDVVQAGQRVAQFLLLLQPTFLVEKPAWIRSTPFNLVAVNLPESEV